MQILLLPLLLLLSSIACAQKISGFIKDETGQAASGAVVGLVRSTDSVTIKWAVAGEAGSYCFTNTDRWAPYSLIG